MDPRHEARDGASAAVDPATRRLCGNVAHTLNWLLHGLVEDAALQGAEVVRVEAAPDASRLRVLVRVPDDGRDRGLVLARLEAARGWLRTEVAAEVRRRRAPDLAFALERASP